MRMRIKPMTANFIPPVYETEGAAAFDIFLQHDLTLTPHKPVTFGLGFGADMDRRGAQVRSPPAEHHRAD